MRRVTTGRVFRRTSVPDPPIAVEAHGSDDPRRGRARIPRRRGRCDRGQRGPRPARDRHGDGRAGRAPGLRPRQRVHDRAARGLCARGRSPPARRRPGDLPGLRWLRSDRDGAQAGPRLSPRPRRDRALDRLRAVGQLSRQHVGRPRPVRAQAVAPPVRGLARALPPRLGGLPVPRRAARRECARERGRAGDGARPGVRGRRSRQRRRVRRGADRGRHAGCRRPARRLLAGDRGRLPSARRAAHRR